jgi:hypothetical protein
MIQELTVDLRRAPRDRWDLALDAIPIETREGHSDLSDSTNATRSSSTRTVALDDGTRLEVARVCGAAANFFFPGLLIFGLLNGMASSVLQSVLNHERRHRSETPSG